MTNLSRRNLIKLSLGGALGLAAGASATACAGTPPTPAQTEGPFHPLGRRRAADGTVIEEDRRLLQLVDKDADLTFVADKHGTAYGRQVVVTGLVRDEQDQPLSGALVEIWQACVTGRYNHRSDPSREWLDPSFQYWGRATTDAAGRYAFRTIVPGAYRADSSWIRPPHIHYKIARRGYQDLTTQLYFRGTGFYYDGRMYQADVLERLNERDQILAGVPRDQRERVIAALRDARQGEAVPAGLKVCDMDITLRAVPRAGGTQPVSDDLGQLLL
ncbi:MAG: hypothetical protein AB7N76_29350 [Planctomycetota bacterium]